MSCTTRIRKYKKGKEDAAHDQAVEKNGIATSNAGPREMDHAQRALAPKT